VPAWVALLTGSTNTSPWFSQAALAAPLGLGAGIGALTASLLGRIVDAGST
jgi:hypothetical protein